MRSIRTPLYTLLKLHREHIYFDGLLPPGKHDIRVERLRSYLKQLITYQILNPNRLPTRSDKVELSIESRHLFGTFSVQSTSRGLPATPFLVPAVIEALGSSHHAETVEIVPGEADSYCAQATRRSGGIILTSDSDLLIHNLGDSGAVAFFNQVQLLKCNECSGQNISAGISAASDISNSLGLKNLLRLGFEIKEDSSVTLAEAVRRAKVSIDGGKVDLFQEFCSEYEEIASLVRFPLLTGIHQEIKDPRISELALQTLSSESSTIRMYLPFLIEDTTRASAWSVGSGIRAFAYSLLIISSKRKQMPSILEYSRQANRILPREINLLDSDVCVTYAKAFEERISLIVASFKNCSEATLWRTIGMIEVYSWYIAEERTQQSDDLVANVVNRKRGLSSWQEIQFSAQLQAALYSIRIVSQLLPCTDKFSSNFSNLSLYLLRLPALEELFPHRSKLGTMQLDIQKIKALSKALNAQVGERSEITDEQIDLKEPMEDILEENRFEKPKKAKRKRKGNRREASENPGKQVKQSSNMYEMLDSY